MGEKRYMYITDEDYSAAEAIGISQNRLYQRVRDYGWDVDRAISTPVNKKFASNGRWARWKEKAVVSRATFGSRIHNGWDEETAAMTPKLTPKECTARSKAVQNRTACIPPDKILIAEFNGIKRATAYARVSVYGWSIEDAITIPTMPPNKRPRKKGGGRNG